MLVTAVVDPSAFESVYFDASDYGLHAEDFLKGILRNGILIVDSDNRIRDELLDRLRSVPIKYRQQLEGMLTHLIYSTKKLIKCSPENQRQVRGVSSLDLAIHLKNSFCVDALIASWQSIEHLRAKRELTSDDILLAEYRDSPFEEQRRLYDNLPGIDTLGRDEVDDLFIRAVKYTKWIRFYDKQIGKGTNTSNFRRGIDYILDLWHNHGHFAPKPSTSQRFCEGIGIITCQGCDISDDDTEHEKESKMERNMASLAKVKDELIDPLRNKFPWPIKLILKEDQDDIFHSRYLETQHIIIKVDRGFDLFRGRVFKTNFLDINPAHSDHLKKCRKLKDAYCDPE